MTYTDQDWYRQGHIAPAGQTEERRQITPDNGVHQPMQSPNLITGYSYTTGSGYHGEYPGVVDGVGYGPPQVATEFNEQRVHPGWYPR